MKPKTKAKPVKTSKKKPTPKTEAETLRAQEVETEKRFKHYGRPSIFSKEIADKICIRLMQGESLRKICRDENMPNADTVFQWLLDGAKKGSDGQSLDSAKKDFSEQYARAREVQAEMYFEEALSIAHDGSNDYTIDEETGKAIVNYDHIQRSRLRVDTLKWAVGKMSPRKYGDRQTIETTGPDGGPAQVQIVLPSNGRENLNG